MVNELIENIFTTLGKFKGEIGSFLVDITIFIQVQTSGNMIVKCPLYGCDVELHCQIERIVCRVLKVGQLW